MNARVKLDWFIKIGRPRFFMLAGLVTTALTGCAVPVQQQRLVSKANMQFSDSPVFNYQSKMLTQIESGTAASGGSQAAGCTSCR